MYYVGLDIHQRSTSMEILDCNGKLVKRAEWKLPWPQLADQLKKDAPAPFAVCFEASCGYGYLYEQFSAVAQQVKAAHPGSLRLIYKSKRKNNRVDAGKLARLLYLDAVPSVYVPGRETRLWRQTIEFRQSLLIRLVALKNQIRASLRERGIAAPKGLWTVKGMTWFKTQGESDDPWALRRDLLIEELSELKRKIKRVELQLRKMSDPRPGAALLKTIPGIGPRTAEALVAYIDNANRFNRTIKTEVIANRQFRDNDHVQCHFDPWRDVYNLERPHEALNMATPASRYRPSPRAFPETLPSIEYAPGDQVRKVGKDGYFNFRTVTYKISQAFTGQPVALRATANDAVFNVFYCNQKVAAIDVKNQNRI
jgi:transposase InsO family protein